MSALARRRLGSCRCEGLESRTLLSTVRAGDLDVSFNHTGILTANLGEIAFRSVAVQSDAKIVVAGAIGTPGIPFGPAGTRDFYIARYNMDGTLDKTFGTNGITRSDFGG